MNKMSESLVASTIRDTLKNKSDLINKDNIADILDSYYTKYDEATKKLYYS